MPRLGGLEPAPPPRTQGCAWWPIGAAGPSGAEPPDARTRGSAPELDQGGDPPRAKRLLEWMQEVAFRLCRQGPATPTATCRRGEDEEELLGIGPRSPANLVDLNLESTTRSQSLDSQAQISADHWRWVLRLHPRPARRARAMSVTVRADLEARHDLNPSPVLPGLTQNVAIATGTVE